MGRQSNTRALSLTKRLNSWQPNITLYPLCSPICSTKTIVTKRVRAAPQPPSRSMIPLNVPYARTAGDPKSIKVLTYNILANLYATANPDQFSYCPSWALNWEFRKHKLVQEILQYEADVICLQEVQRQHYNNFFQSQLAEHGYCSIFKSKTTQVITEDAQCDIDGCATFYKESRFKFVKKYEVEFNKAAASTTHAMKDPARQKLAQSRLFKDNIALIAVFEVIGVYHNNHQTNLNGRPLICIANTHIHSNPDLSDVKLWQVHTLLKGMEKIATSADIPIIVAGDFNSEPGSAAHQLITRPHIDANHPEYPDDPLGLLQPNSKLQHQLPLSSAYSMLHLAISAQKNGMKIPDPEMEAKAAQQRQMWDNRTREPMYTNVTQDFTGTLDYLFYTTNSLVPVALLELPSRTELQPYPNTGLPNATYPSDHLALMAEFYLMPRQTNGMRRRSNYV
eukprot:TRINITY_DN12093_c0_g3_i4.p1 TRINITY_DN12093_c0_g3~~TRINITY_DN12093_c0_g3_i4.p1  ORF type:complete len:451 (-),score=30.94 TRINITY_DN12093_c0_g3_i4:1842-3194(-)